MIYPDWMLARWAEEGGIDPYDIECINPASVDLKISGTFVDLTFDLIHTKKEWWLKPGFPILATTVEVITIPKNAVGMVFLKSSLARQGLDHALAGYCDPGFSGQLTMELHAHRPVFLKEYQRVIQLVILECCHPPMKIYNGKYQNQRGPTKAR